MIFIGVRSGLALAVHGLVPWLMVCGLLGLAVVVLVDVGRAPAPRPIAATPVLLVGLARLRVHVRELPPMGRRPRATPTFFVEQPDAAGEIDAGPRAAPDAAPLPSVIVDG